MWIDKKCSLIFYFDKTMTTIIKDIKLNGMSLPLNILTHLYIILKYFIWECVVWKMEITRTTKLTLTIKVVEF